MGFLSGACLPVALIAICLAADAQNLGAPPPFTLSESDIYTSFGLPALADATGTQAQTDAARTQVYQRAQALGLTSQSALTAWSAAQAAMSASMPGSGTPGSWIQYSGATASGLNRLLATSSGTAFQVTSAAISIDQPIEIQRSGITLSLGSAAISGGAPGTYMLRIENALNVSVTGGNLISGDSAILVNNCQHSSVSGATISNVTGAGIVVTLSQYVSVMRNRITGLDLAPIIVHRGSTGAYVAGNDIEQNLGASNMTAGIVLTDRQVDVTGNPRTLFGPDGYPGIFLDSGSDQNVILENTIEDATNWAIESAQQMTNTSTDNLTHLSSRNIGSGLDPSLVTSGQPVNDPPPAPAGRSLRKHASIQ